MTVRRKSEHVGTHARRLRDDVSARERVFAHTWALVNSREHGTQILEVLLAGGSPPLELEARDATVAATVVQWLGTNVGWDFLRQCVERCGFDLKEMKRGDWNATAPVKRLTLGMTASPMHLGNCPHCGDWLNQQTAEQRKPARVPVLDGAEHVAVRACARCGGRYVVPSPEPDAWRE